MSKRICVFGASVTKGAWDTEMGGWVNRLRLDLEDFKKRKYSVYNLGISGDTTESLLERIDSECKARNSEIIIIGIGSNDSSFRKNKNNYFVSPEKFKENIIKIIKIAKTYTDKIIFIGLTKVDEKRTTPVFWDPNAFYRNIDIVKYNKIIKEVSQAESISIVELYDIIKVDDLKDGLHPNAKGHKKIFQKVKDELIMNKIIK